MVVNNCNFPTIPHERNDKTIVEIKKTNLIKNKIKEYFLDPSPHLVPNFSLRRINTKNFGLEIFHKTKKFEHHS